MRERRTRNTHQRKCAGSTPNYVPLLLKYKRTYGMGEGGERHTMGSHTREVVGWCAECVRLIAMMVLPQVTCLYYEVKTPFGRFYSMFPKCAT